MEVVTQYKHLTFLALSTISAIVVTIAARQFGDLSFIFITLASFFTSLIAFKIYDILAHKSLDTKPSTGLEYEKEEATHLAAMVEDDQLHLNIKNINELDLKKLLHTIQSINEQQMETRLDLARSRATIESIYHSVGDAVVTFSASGKVQTLNPAAEKMFGYQQAEMSGVHVSKLLAPNHRASYVKMFRQYADASPGAELALSFAGIPEELDGLHKDNTQFPMEISRSLLDKEIGGEKFFTAIIRDISMRKKEQQRQVARNQLLEIKLSIAKLLSRSHHIREKLDNALECLLETNVLGQEDALGICVFNTSDDEICLLKHHNLVNQEKLKQHISNWRNEEHNVFCQVTTDDGIIQFTPILDNAHNKSYQLGCLFICSPRDLSETQNHEFQALLSDVSEMMTWAIIQDRARELLKRAITTANQNDQLKGQFISTMSHEIRTPLNGILGMISLLDKSELSERQRNQLAIAQASAKDLNRLINDLLDLSRFESGRVELSLEPFNLKQLMVEIMSQVAPQAQKKSLDLSVKLTPDPTPLVIGDQRHIHNVFIHLIENAIKFTVQGKITITAELEDIGNSHYKLCGLVQDTGVGIETKHLDMLFSKFTQADGSLTRAYGGTGIGLTLCKQSVELMGGSISVSSSVGLGSQFEFNVTLQSMEQIKSFKPRTRIPNHGPTVLPSELGQQQSNTTN